MSDPDRADRVRVCDCPEYRYRVCDVCQCVTGVEVADPTSRESCEWCVHRRVPGCPACRPLDQRQRLHSLEEVLDEAARAQEAELERLRGRVEAADRLRRDLWQAFGRPDGVGLDAELVDAAHDWRRSSLDRGKELERLLREDHDRCARDEAATAVVQAWREFERVSRSTGGPVSDRLELALWRACDELAREHEDEGDVK